MIPKGPELIILIVLIIIIFGARKLPELGKGIGEGIKNFKKSIRGDDDSKPKDRDEDDKDRKDKSA
jgi:sec-independent protein translocase protein TatA